jgi:uridine kinase
MMADAQNPDIMEQLSDLICTVERPHPIRVAIDGVDAAGKTILADNLAPLIEKRGWSAIRASLDGFHNPRKVRYRRGTDSPEGYYRDSFNYEILRQYLLIPLGPGGDRKYRRTAFNLQQDAPVEAAWHQAHPNAILLFDGVFLLRPELVKYWDYSIFIAVEFNVSVPRAVLRDVMQSGQKWETNTRRVHYERRYIPGQQLYLKEAKPKSQASIIIDNNDFQNPIIIAR